MVCKDDLKRFPKAKEDRKRRLFLMRKLKKYAEFLSPTKTKFYFENCGKLLDSMKSDKAFSWLLMNWVLNMVFFYVEKNDLKRALSTYEHWTRKLLEIYWPDCEILKETA